MGECEKFAEALGLDVSKKPNSWRLLVRIETHAKVPKKEPTRSKDFFSIVVCYEMWWVMVQHKGKQWSYTKPKINPGGLGYRELEIEPPKSLAVVRPWLRVVEKQLGVAFRREAPYVESIVKGGAKAMAVWIAEPL